MKEIEKRAYVYILTLSVRKCRFRQTTVEYEILPLMLPLLLTITRHSSLRFVYRRSTQSRFVFKRLRAINENQMENHAMKCLQCRRFAFMWNARHLIGLQNCVIYS